MELSIMNKSIFILVLGSIFLASCASSNRSKTMGLTLAAGSLGAIYGASQADYKPQNAMMFGAVAAAIAATAGQFIFDEEKRAEEFRLKSLELQTRLDGSSQSDLSDQTSKILSQGQSVFSEASLPEEYQHLVRPGGWKIFEINRWVKKGTNRLVLESKLIEFTPPQIQPNLSN
jgi:hypothetical protein